MFQKNKIGLIILMLGVLGIAGCNAIFPTAQTVPVPNEAAADTGADSPVSPNDQSSEEGGDTTDGEAGEMAEDNTISVTPTEAQAVATATEEGSGPPEDPDEVDTSIPDSLQPVRQELAATDPSTVSLASGDVQLVEFFAFW